MGSKRKRNKDSQASKQFDGALPDFGFAPGGSDQHDPEHDIDTAWGSYHFHLFTHDRMLTGIRMCVPHGMPSNFMIDSLHQAHNELCQEMIGKEPSCPLTGCGCHTEMFRLEVLPEEDYSRALVAVGNRLVHAGSDYV